MTADTTPQEELNPSNSGELKNWIEANYLDGDKVQQGQLISAYELVNDLPRLIERKVLEGKIESLDKVRYNTDHLGAYLNMTLSDLTDQLKQLEGRE